MKRLIEFIIIAVLTHTLRAAGIPISSWQHWVIILCAFALGLVEVIAREVET